MKVLHRMEEHDPVPMPKVRLSLLELPQNYAVRIRNWLARFIFPVSHRDPISFAWRFYEVGHVCRHTSLLDFADMRSVQTIRNGRIPAYLY